jgi:hypothetical protein
LGAGLCLGLSAAAQPATGDAWRLDDFDKTSAPNEVYGKWAARKFAPVFGAGERFFFQFVHGAAEHEIVLRSGKDNSFSLGIETPFRLQSWPVLEWEWNIGQLPKGGDVRVRERDDQAGSICVLVNPGLVGFETLCYLFENDGPKDVPIVSRQRDGSRYLIVRTAKAGDPLGQWLKEKRNALEDYRRVYGKEPDREAVFTLLIDSNDTHSAAEARYRNIYLRKS